MSFNIPYTTGRKNIPRLRNLIPLNKKAGGSHLSRKMKEDEMKIIVGYKEQRMSKKILDLAKLHAKAFNATVYILSSLEGGSGQKIEEIDEAKGKLNYAEEVLKEAGVKVRSELLIRGLSAGEDIVQFAKEQKADEIIVGIKMKSKVGKLILGSTAQYIILNASCPVVAIGT
jgi:nucleotide-binding universal stress UspA family protein